MIQILVKETCNTYLLKWNEKGMSFMNFNIENAKTLRMEWKKNYYNMAHLFTEILIISWHTEI